jgi:hypothetical protein
MSPKKTLLTRSTMPCKLYYVWQFCLQLTFPTFPALGTVQEDFGMGTTLYPVVICNRQLILALTEGIL